MEDFKDLYIKCDNCKLVMIIDKFNIMVTDKSKIIKNRFNCKCPFCFEEYTLNVIKKKEDIALLLSRKVSNLVE